VSAWATEYLNVRSGPSASLPKLSILHPGQKVEQTSRVANNYQQILVDGQTGWVQAKYLTTSEPAGPSQSAVASSATATGKAGTSGQASSPSSSAAGTSTQTSSPVVYGAYLTANVNLREAAGTDQDSLGVLPADSRINLRGVQIEGWTPVAADGRSGWVKSSFLTAVAPAHPVAAKLVPTTGRTTVADSAKTLAAGATASKTPATTSVATNSVATPAVATKAPATTTALATAEAVTTNVVAKKASTVSSTKIVYATVDLNVRAGAGTGYAKVGRMVRGAHVGTRGASVNGWTPVNFQGRSAWIYSSLISTTKPKVASNPAKSSSPGSGGTPESRFIVYATVDLNVRAGAGTGYAKVGRMVRGAHVGTRGASVNGWTPVNFQGRSAWIYSSLISTTKPKVSASTGSSAGNGSSSTPRSYSAVPGKGGVDPWGFYWGQCVSYVAWQVRLNTSNANFQNVYKGVHFGNASNWASAARSLGITVNTTPTVGSVAWRQSGFAGHVAYVTAVHANGTIDVAEYNFSVSEGYDTRRNLNWRGGGSSGFDAFIHF